MKKFFLFIALGAMFFGGEAFAAEEAEANDAPKEAKQTTCNGATNLQAFYDFGADRNCVTTTLEGFYSDPWGNTFFFIDHDYGFTKDGVDSNEANNGGVDNQQIRGTYWEIARCLNFWQNTGANFLSLQVEYNGGAYRGYNINHSFLGGLDFFVHSSDFSNTFNFKVLYKYIMGQSGNVPMQFTFVWGMKDIFNVKGLAFSGFADVWGEKHMVYDVNMKTGNTDWVTSGKEVGLVFLSEPQLWYNVGQHFGCSNLNVGGEVEMSVNFGTAKGFKCRPCLGLKWVF